MAFLPQFLFLQADFSCSKQTQEQVYHQVLDVRKNQRQPVFCIELFGDMLKIDEVISDDACIIGFETDGTLHMYSGMECEETYNIFESSLEDILYAAAPRT
jgi:hypothetical protein